MYVVCLSCLEPSKDAWYRKIMNIYLEGWLRCIYIYIESEISLKKIRCIYTEDETCGYLYIAERRIVHEEMSEKEYIRFMEANWWLRKVKEIEEIFYMA